MNTNTTTSYQPALDRLMTRLSRDAAKFEQLAADCHATFSQLVEAGVSPSDPHYREVWRMRQDAYATAQERYEEMSALIAIGAVK